VGKALRRAGLTAVGLVLGAVLGLPLCAARASAGPADQAPMAAPAAQAPGAAEPAPSSVPQARHVVIVGIAGLTWNQISPAATPELWRLADGGSVGSLVDYAQQPLACAADGWLTLNSAARAQGPRPCAGLPAVVPAGAGSRIPAMPQIIAANRQYHEAPRWGLLRSLAGCATAVGPGAALALADAAGTVAGYLPSAARLPESALARCPLTVVDLNQPHAQERVRLTLIDQQLAKIVADLPAGTLMLITAPGAAARPATDAAPAGRPHLMTVLVSGPRYATGLLSASSTRRPGIVALTDLTPTVAAWLGQRVPAGTVGAQITRTPRGSLPATISALLGRDTAEQVWLSTHGWFFAGYAIAAGAACCLAALLAPGSEAACRRRRARNLRLAGLAATALPLGSYLANLAPWRTLAHPAWWLYGLTLGWTVVAALVALAGPWRRDPLGPPLALCAATLLLLVTDVASGSRLQLEAPFGLSLLTSGRYYGIGNDALGVYCVCALAAAFWAARLLNLTGTRPVTSRGTSTGSSTWTSRGTSAGVAGAAAVGLLAVAVSGWPGLGAKVGGTIALVPCLVVLVARLAGVRIGRRWLVPVAASGVLVFLGFALLSYFVPAAGVSDLGTFAGNLLHGRGGDVLERKATADVGSLTLGPLGWLIPVTAAACAAALWRPGALRLRLLDDAFSAAPDVRLLAWLSWLALVLGWFADDSGVVVAAAAIPFAVPLTIAMASSVSAAAAGAGYFGTAFAGSSVAGSPGNTPGNRSVASDMPPWTPGWHPPET
jgi:hypothetical protein